MRILTLRRPDPALQELGSQLAAVRSALRELREINDVMWALQPPWLTEAIQHARRTGWTISLLGRELRFAHTEFRDECTIPTPLPADAQEQLRLARDLHLRIGLTPARSVTSQLGFGRPAMRVMDLH